MKNLKFSDVSKFINDKVELSNLQNEQYISTENMLPNYGGIVEIDKLPKIEKCNKFKQGDILFSNIRTYFKKVWVAEFSGGCSPDVLIIRSKDESIVRTSYLYLLICSDDFINFTVASSNGAKMPRGDKNAIKNYIFNIPDIAFQDKAINTYFRFKKKITLNTQTNQTLEQIAQAIFKHWFIDFAPVHAKANALASGASPEQAELAAMACLSGKTVEKITALKTQDPTAYHQLQRTARAFPSEFVETEMGLVPKGWEVKQVKDLAKFVKGKKPKILSEAPNKNLLPYITMATLSDKNNSFADPQGMITSDKLDILISMDGAAGNISIGHKGIVGSTFAKIELINNKLIPYFYQFMKNKEEDIKSNTTGTSVPHTDKERVLNYFIAMPNNILIDNFSKLYLDILEKILLYKVENKTLENTRNTLLPKLLSGEIEL